VNLEETAALVTWLGQYDGRVQMTNATCDIWHNAISAFEFGIAQQAILDHYKDNDQFPASPATIKKRASAIVARSQAQQSALTAGPSRPDKTEADYRRKIRETPEFMALFEQGRREGNAERAYATVLRETGDRNQAFAARDRILYADGEAA
jgi:hypothetical protein